jgi:hypothetical protein
MRPTSLEPVKLMALMSGCSQRGAPTSSPVPTTMFSTPGGSPASSKSLHSSSAIAGVCSAGLRTTVFPATRAGPIFQAGMAQGKFQGVINPTTPMGTRVV